MTASEHTAFSTFDEDAISRRIDVEVDRTADKLSSSREFEEFYEIERTAREIVEGGFKRVSGDQPGGVRSVYDLIRFHHIDRWLSNFLTNYFMTLSPSIEGSRLELEKEQIYMCLQTHPMAGRLFFSTVTSSVDQRLLFFRLGVPYC